MVSKKRILKHHLRIIAYLTFIVNSSYLVAHTQYTKDANALHLYTWGTYSMLEENYTLSEKIFETLRANYALEPYMYDSYIGYLFKANRYQDIVALEPLITSQLMSSLFVQQAFLHALEITGNQEKADAHIARLYARYPNNPEMAYAYALILIRNKQTAEAMKIAYTYIKDSENQQYAFLFHFLAAQLYAGANKLVEAETEIRIVQKLNPLFEQGWLFGAVLSELQGNIIHAIQNYTQFIELTGDHQAVRNQIALLTKQAMQQQNAQTHFEKALLLYKNKQYAQALREIETHLTHNPHHTSGHILAIEIVWASGQYAHAYGLIYKHIEKNPNDAVWLKITFLLYKANVNKEHLLRLLTSMEKKQEPSLLTAYLADIYIKEKDYTAATDYLTKIIYKSSLSTIVPKALYQLLCLYFNTGEFEKIPSLIEYGLASRITFSPFLNLAAYFYAHTPETISNAERLIQTALAHDQNNIYYLDTQAFIWYKQKKYTQAEELLTKLSREAPTNFFIAKHLGKTLHKQNKLLESKQIFQQALTMNAIAHEKDTLKKIIASFNE